MSADAPRHRTDPPPPSEIQRAIRAAVLGAALGVVLAILGRSRSRPV